MSQALLPPVSGPSRIQLERMLLLGEDIDPKDYKGLDFCTKFKERYGHNPVPYYRTWEGLLKFPVTKSLIPKYKMSFVRLATTISFVSFCKGSDRLALQRNAKVLGKQELESAWVQELVCKFDMTESESIIVLVKDTSIPTVKNAQEALQWMQTKLRQAINKRYLARGINEYWTGKAPKYDLPDLDIRGVMDGEWEPQYKDDVEINDTDDVIENGKFEDED